MKFEKSKDGGDGRKNNDSKYVPKNKLQKKWS